MSNNPSTTLHPMNPVAPVTRIGSPYPIRNRSCHACDARSRSCIESLLSNSVMPFRDCGLSGHGETGRYRNIFRPTKDLSAGQETVLLGIDWMRLHLDR